MTGRRLLAMATIGLGLWGGLPTGGEAAGAAEQERFRRVVRHHLETYPSMEIRDLYKLTFQAAMGSEHAVPSREAARQWLEHELSTLETVSVESFSEPLSPDGDLVRVNLRAFVDSGGDLDGLLEAFVGTANQYQGSEERLERYWSYIEVMARKQEIPFDAVQVRQLWGEMVSQGLPAVHHSAPYRDRYQPAYRVVLLELLGPDVPTITGR